VNYVCDGRQSIEILKDVKPLATKAADIAADLANGKDVVADSTIDVDGIKVPLASVRVALVTRDTVKGVVVESGFLGASALTSCSKVLATRGGTR
jgi:ABC-type xylose transport system substrate-binding protein